jgi:hypothetical protein
VAIALSALLSVGGGGGTAWLVTDVKLAWLRSDLGRAEQRVEQLEARDRAMIGFQAQITETVSSLRAEVTAVRYDMRSDAAEVRRLLEALRWGRR